MLPVDSAVGAHESPTAVGHPVNLTYDAQTTDPPMTRAKSPAEKLGNRRPGVASFRETPLTEVQPRAVTPNQVHSPFPLILFQAPHIPFIRFTCILNLMSTQSKSQPASSAEGGFVFSKIEK
jgi:hypothetical protein